MKRLTAVLALLGSVGLTTAWAGTWADYQSAFPSMPCQDGWMACKVNGQDVSPGMLTDSQSMPVPSDMRLGWYDLQPTPAFSPFVALSVYTGEAPPTTGDDGVAAVDPGPAPAPIPPPMPTIDPEEEARKAREAAERQAAQRAEEARRQAEAEMRAKEDKARRQAEAARAAEEERLKKEREAAMAAASDDEARKQAEADAKRREEEARKKREEEERRRQEELERERKAAEAAAAAEAERVRKQAEEEARRAEEEARKKAEEEARKQEEERKRLEEEARKKAEAEAARKAEEEADGGDGVAALDNGSPPPAPGSDGGCSDLIRLEPVAMLGKLNKGQQDCLEASISTAAKQTEKEKISLILMANAYAKGDKGAWERLVKRHLDEIDQSNPDLCYKYALHLSRKGPARAYGVIKWADVALENRTVWTGDTYTSRVYSLYKLKAAAAQQLWQSAEEKHAASPSEETKKAVDDNRNMTKVMAREWYEYAKVAGKDTSKALQLCMSAAGTKDYCEAG